MDWAGLPILFDRIDHIDHIDHIEWESCGRVLDQESQLTKLLQGW